MNSPINCFTLPPNMPFLHSLARWLLANYGEDAGEFTKLLVLLPNRRACRSLREAFLEITNGKPLLLPRIQPIGELDDDELLLLDTGHESAQPINTLRRQFLLMQLVMRFQQGRGAGGSVEQAAELAHHLANFMDDVAREHVSFDALADLVPENLADHWQQTLDFLTILSHEWPKLLASEGLVAPVEYRNQQLTHNAKLWEQSPPPYPIIAAGSTGSQPATAALLKVISRLPQGRVILPALDKNMPEDEWKIVSDTHPQYGLKKLLATLDISRAQVEYLLPYQQGERESLLRAIFAPPVATAQWAHMSLAEDGLKGITYLETDTQLDEARLIAVMLREALETPEKTVALVTPDRALARMVAATMQRFGVMLDDSAGKMLSTSAPACFLRLVIDMVASRAAPASLLAVLRHPLAGAGLATSQCRRLSRELELTLLRGIRRGSGLANLREAARSDALKTFLTELERAMAPLTELISNNRIIPFAELLSSHIHFAQWLSTTDSEHGEKRLWEGEAGNALAAFIADIAAHADVLPAIDPMVYGGLFDVLLSRQTYRLNYGAHPRLHILSPMEARLQRFDKVILASLNEGTWPKAADADPWMSRPMRAAFGLPSPERTIGQSAHDVMMLCFAPEVIFTRARKVEGAPTVPSRWWVRFKTLVNGRLPEAFANMQREAYYAPAKLLLEQAADIAPLRAPTPIPPLAARPRKLRVTAIDTWLRDPYMVYAKNILALKKLDDIDREPNAADFGTLVHKALELFTRDYPSVLPEDAYKKLIACGAAAFEDFMDRPAVACLWWPRFEAMAQWLLETEKLRRDTITSVHSEIKGEWVFEVASKPFTLSTRIDRIEELKDGGRAIIDYKTGTVPTKSELERGLANQLALESLIAMDGKLDGGVAQKSVTQAEYWKLAGEETKCKITNVKLDIEATRSRLYALIQEFDDATMPYAAQTDPSLVPRYNDYAHLTRRSEWEES